MPGAGNVRDMFDPAKAEQICELISSGETVSATARKLKIGRRTIHDWRENAPEFAAQFARAKDDGYDAIADEVLRIADEVPAIGDEVQRARLRTDARIKLLAKWDPKRYGDKLQVDQDTTLRVVVEDPTRVVRQVSAPTVLQVATSVATLVAKEDPLA